MITQRDMIELILAAHSQQGVAGHWYKQRCYKQYRLCRQTLVADKGIGTHIVPIAHNHAAVKIYIEELPVQRARPNTLPHFFLIPSCLDTTLSIAAAYHQAWNSSEYSFEYDALSIIPRTTEISRELCTYDYIKHTARAMHI